MTLSPSEIERLIQEQLQPGEAAVIQSIRHLRMTARHGGSVTFYLAESGKWRIKEQHTMAKGDGR